jgi:hypothetical protein
MSNFFINTGNSTVQNGQSFNGFDAYAVGTRQAVPNIATTLQGQSTVGARNIVMVYQMGLRVGGGTYDPGTGASTRPFIGCWRIWSTQAAPGTATPVSASAQFTIAAVGNISTTKVLTIRDMPDVILNGGSTYLFGFNNAQTTTAIWAGFSRRTSIPTQDVYQDTLSSTPNDDSFVLRTTGGNPGILHADSSIMGQVYYFTIPPAPVITSITKLTNGVTINFTVSETSSSTTTGCKAYFSLDNITFNVVTGTFAGSGGSYTFQITTTALTLGQSYYFEVCALNAVTNLDNTNNPTYDTRSLDSNSVLQQYGDTPTQSVAISGNVTYNGSAQAYTLTGTPASPAPTGSPASFTDAGTYTSANISVTAGSGYTLGAVTGSFVINPITITAMSFTLDGSPFTSNQSRTADTTSYTIAVSSTTPSGGSVSPTSTTVSSAGNYTLSSSGTGNYQGGPFTSPVLTLTPGANFIKVRNASNVWVNATLSVRNASNVWVQGTAKVRNSTNTDWINNY